MNIIAATCSYDVDHECTGCSEQLRYIYEHDVVSKLCCHRKSVLHPRYISRHSCLPLFNSLGESRDWKKERGGQ